VVVQVADTFFSALRLPEWSVTLVAGLAVLGFPITVVLAWLFDRTPEGLQRTPSPSASRAGAHASGDRRRGMVREGETGGSAFVVTGSQRRAVMGAAPWSRVTGL
ncbi:MAG TPA: hypothetical protein VK845_08235, partial [Gemmatimonadales bacterium]|nr:hypothetical protein [Gemmatimonadales bacterium]